ncbi:MAG: nicotinate-nucleotide diphosphorylase (carboxylating) [Deltaproteobacteria bacterium RIFCSPLOWO2_12_FULL_44_12]|nr:MAG: nicotinate-nucleotide diphosphorylase (carboxylating) [Deltaproteobacteria bacterium RIFCSPHIGHO2_01_FULL_43_49]OGQ14666.1 MAG: nicotinate-nucleotide diphosphorylase (carboxylating) [Deltaproteobacteria bacterium RIFCSPHIGHO2_02_FULL_44_53]OGQ28052.1 MAG: nicotinate-nucleotide diphosphorylase (carboxylating) [Deltaproteobacteria bacterium RIFCSPHIGHO2_12_FULL_44_21]OGQ31264.1 MAG: nicotinate-nucleotide diphosphorylase (carboxylating) [Deltaproteobacteria bacterium RIFCSPLOWO2_01_FULL_45_
MDLKTIIEQALEEDINGGDITTECIVDPNVQTTAKIIAKQNLVVAGLDVAHKVFLHLDPNCEWVAAKKDGDEVLNNEILAKIKGKSASLLKGERVALNFLQHLSGIATLTRQFVDAVQGTKAKILDTRKTLPLWRALEKYAVRMGGGNNHRLGLFDRYLIKNNHIQIAGSVSKAIEKILKKKKSDTLLEVEVRNFEELKEALNYPLDIILLDNFTPKQVKEAITTAKGKVKFEVSGGINLDNVAQYAATGVDFISSGALTHSAPAADLHLTIE